MVKKHLILVDGVSGSGKSTFFKYIKDNYSAFSFVPKYTTRPSRLTDDPQKDLTIPLPEVDFFDKMDFIHSKENNSTGILKVDIGKAANISDIIIVSGNLKLFQLVIDYYKNDFTISRLLIKTDREQIKQRLISSTNTKEELEHRLANLEKSTPRSDLWYDIILCNNGSICSFLTDIDKFIESTQLSRFDEAI